MKIRNGFVSNSSSSSFIVAADNKDKLKITMEVEVNLNSFVRHVFNDIEDLIKYYKDDYGMEIEELKKYKPYLQAKKAIESGQTVFIGSFSSEGEPTEQFLCEQGLPAKVKGITVIDSEGGY